MVELLSSYSLALAAPKRFLNVIQSKLEVLAELLAHGSPEIVGVVALADGGRDTAIGCLINEQSIYYQLCFQTYLEKNRGWSNWI